MNERITEQMVRDELRLLGYYDNEFIHVEEQKSANRRIQLCLSRASKSGGKGVGKPEFIIKSDEHGSFVMIIECKADPRKHESASKDKFAEFAVDGLLLYASCLSVEFNVIAVAVSGQNKAELRTSVYVHAKGEHEPSVLRDKSDRALDRIVSYDDFILLATYDKNVEHSQYNDLIEYSQVLHNYIRDYTGLSEAEKPLLVSGILIALGDSAFRKSYREARDSRLPNDLLNKIRDEIRDAEMPQSKEKHIAQPYDFIGVHPALARVNPKIKQNPLKEIISGLDQRVYPFITVHHNFDVIGQFYAEFLRYAGGDASLGIVLTPKHITELFADIANLAPSSVVLDICAGTSGFLIASMIDMCRKARGDEEQIEQIKKSGLIGIENQPKMFALGASNMILRGDGKANLFYGSCFDPRLIREVKTLNPNVGMVNPPYSQKGEGLHELNFVEQMLDCLVPGSIGIAIVPMSCAIQSHPLRQTLMMSHSLLAVMSMPDDLFYPVGVIPCIMVWKAKVPHDSDPYHKTWFGYWKDDGFEKVKNKGRIDLNKQWETVKGKWLSAYRNRQEIPGFSALRTVNADDEWCAEAYMETDYSDLKTEDFIEQLKNYALFKAKNS